MVMAVMFVVLDHLFFSMGQKYSILSNHKNNRPKN